MTHQLLTHQYVGYIVAISLSRSLSPSSGHPAVYSRYTSDGGYRATALFFQFKGSQFVIGWLDAEKEARCTPTSMCLQCSFTSRLSSRPSSSFLHSSPKNGRGHFKFITKTYCCKVKKIKAYSILSNLVIKVNAERKPYGTQNRMSSWQLGYLIFRLRCNRHRHGALLL